MKSLYTRELKQLYYFSFFLIPLLSAFSILTGHYFLARHILVSVLPFVSVYVITLVGLLSVIFIELVKYFLTPILVKSAWHKHWRLFVGILPMVCMFSGASMYFSIRGVQGYYVTHDVSKTKLEEAFEFRRRQVEARYDSLLAVEADRLVELKKDAAAQDIIKKLERINRQMDSYEKRRITTLRRVINKDSVNRRYSRLMASLEKDKSLVQASATTLREMETVQENQQILDLEKREALQKLEDEKSSALERASTETSFIARHVFWLSLSVEMLLLIAIGYWQFYRLLTCEKPKSNSVKKRIDENENPKPLPKPRQKRKRITPRVRDQIRQGLAEGMKPKELARKYKVAERTVFRIQKE